MVEETNTLYSNISVGPPGPTLQFRSDLYIGQVGETQEWHGIEIVESWYIIWRFQELYSVGHISQSAKAQFN